jgi:WD40 repeat protein
MAISKDSDFIAFGGSNKLINVFPFKKIEIGIKKSGEIEPSIDERSHCNFGLYSEEDLPKLILEYHNDTVNAIDFTKTHKNYLVSGGSDKCLIIWEILEHNFSYEKLRILKSTSDITDLKIIPNDEFIFASCVDNKIYTWRTNFNGRSFELVYCHNDLHSNFITSICLDPLFNNLNSEEINERIQKSGMRLASYSDDGELVVSEFFYNASGCKSNTMKNFKEFINFKNKVNSIHKKIE